MIITKENCPARWTAAAERLIDERPHELEILSLSDKEIYIEVYNIDVDNDSEPYPKDPEVTFTVTYQSNGAVGSVPIDSNNYKAGDKYTVLPYDDLEGDIIGWRNKDTYQRPNVGYEFVINSNIVLEAIWIDYTNLKYISNGGLGEVPVDINHYKEGDIVTIMNSGDLHGSASNFIGWSPSTNPAYIGPYYYPGNTIVMSNDISSFYRNYESNGVSNIFLYAKWTKVEEPNILPASGTYSTEQLITITTFTPDCSIYYTSDGSEPSDTNGILYSEPFEILTSQTIRVRAYKEDWESSVIINRNYTINLG